MKPVIQPLSLFLAQGLPLADTLQAGLRLLSLPVSGAELEQTVHAEAPQALRGQRRPEPSQPLAH